jgi:UDP-N-acetylmuramate--alanine ligase
MEHIHFIGIGGTGLSAIARVLLEQGLQVSGSDLHPSPLFESVKEAGGSVFLGHKADYIQGADLVIRSSAIPDDNPEVQAALAAGIPVLKRSEFLGELTTGKKVIAVAGSHGKTTTTAMVVWILSRQGLDPSFIVGGVVSDLDTNARAGSGDYFVIEADEYDYMFLGLRPSIAAVTNVEHDHPDIFPTPNSFEDAFRRFVANLEPDGTLILCGENPGARVLADVLKSGQKLKVYGFENPDWEYSAHQLKVNTAAGMDFELRIQDSDGESSLPLSLKIPGEHNVLNALAAFAIADSLGVDREDIVRSLSTFSGSGRRFEIRGEIAGVLLVDDYAHHPTEILATLSAARSAYPERYIRAVWQPHTYSRTTTLYQDFTKAFLSADQVLVLDVYEAREDKPEDFQMLDLVNAIQHDNVLFLPALDQAAAYLEGELRAGDMLLIFTAGDAIEINDRVEKTLLERNETKRGE